MEFTIENIIATIKGMQEFSLSCADKLEADGNVNTARLQEAKAAAFAQAIRVMTDMDYFTRTSELFAE